MFKYFKKYVFSIEKIGVFLSIACAVHCLTLPIFLFFAPYLGLGILIKLIDMSLVNQSYAWLFGISLGVVISAAYWVNYKHKKSCTCKISA
jgi:hypothetical protein